MTTETYFIAEVGVNHNGSIELAYKLIDQAVKAGANAVKFQTFEADSLTTADAKKADYQKQNVHDTETQHSMLKKLELSLEDHFRLKEYCDAKGIEFISTPFDIQKVHFLAKELGVKRLKIGSADIINSPLLLEAAKTRLPVILSTGMSTLEEIIEAIAIFAFEEKYPNQLPKSRQDLNPFCEMNQWSHALRSRLTLLHCVSLYPTPDYLVNLRSIEFLRQATGLPVGFSDHSEGVSMSLAAVALGAVVIEKHFTLSKSLPGPDHPASLEPNELKYLVEEIRKIEQGLGEAKKLPNDLEHRTAKVARSSLIAMSEIEKDTPFTPSNLTVKRPGTGISPHFYWDAIHSWKAKRNFKQDELIGT